MPSNGESSRKSDPTVSPGRRLLHTLLIALLIAGGAIAVTGIATDATTPGDRVELSAFEVPQPHVGDKGAYVKVLEDGSFTKLGEHLEAFAFEWVEPSQLYDRDGVHHWTNDLAVTAHQAAPPGPGELPHVETRVNHFDRSDWGLVGYTHLYDETSIDEIPGLPLPVERQHGWSGSTTYLLEAEQQTRTAYEIPCGLKHPLQGDPFPLDKDVDMGDCRVWGQHLLIHEPRLRFQVAYELDGVLYADFTGDAPEKNTGITHMRLQEDTPYPILVTYQDREGATHDYVLVGFERGDRPLASAQAERDSLPGLEWTADVPDWGLDDSGIDHPYPLSQAWDDALTNPQFAEFQALADDPGAYVQYNWYWEYYDEEGMINHQWHIELTDGRDTAVACPSRQSAGDRELALPPIMTLEPFTTVWGCNSPREEGGIVGYGVGARPTVASLERVWESLSPVMGTDFPLRDYGVWVYEWDDGPFEEYRLGTDTRDTSNLDPLVGQLEPREALRETYNIRIGQDGQLIGWSTSNYGDQYAPAGTFDEPDGSTLQSTEPSVGWRLPHCGELAAAGLFAAAAGALYWLWPWLKVHFIAPLFSRIERPQALKNPNRLLVMETIRGEPGIHKEELRRKTGLSAGSIHHHVEKLMHTGLVGRRRNGGYTCYYPVGVDVRAVDLQAAARSPTAKRILSVLQEHPEATAQQIATRLGMSRQSVHYHLRRMRASGLQAAARA